MLNGYDGVELSRDMMERQRGSCHARRAQPAGRVPPIVVGMFYSTSTGSTTEVAESIESKLYGKADNAFDIEDVATTATLKDYKLLFGGLTSVEHGSGHGALGHVMARISVQAA